MDEAIVNEIRARHSLLIGLDRAEQLKVAIGSALATRRPTAVAEATGRDLVSGEIRRISVAADELQEALEPVVSRILGAVRETLEETPPELAADIVRCGIVLAGGGVLLHGLARRLQIETQLPVTIASDPLTCVAIGAGHSLDRP